MYQEESLTTLVDDVREAYKETLDKHNTFCEEELNDIETSPSPEQIAEQKETEVLGLLEAAINSHILPERLIDEEN